ncbi:MAG: hypothetical protein ACI9WS_003409 [Paraglaciecola psychrophila]|jgi:hypothetical protein
MTVLKKQALLTNTLFEINRSALREYSQIQRQNLGKYIELNKNYAQQLPALESVSSLLSLQREYHKMIWNDLKVSANSQGQLIRNTLQETGTALKEALMSTQQTDQLS